MGGEGALKYAVINAFTATPFKGNPAAVCLVPPHRLDDPLWMQSVAAEFNVPVTAFLAPDASHSLLRLRWFTTIVEVPLCGHATLAAAHYLFSSLIVAGGAVEFATASGVLVARKAPGGGIELDFPFVPVVDCDLKEALSMPVTLQEAEVVGVRRTGVDDLLIELSSGEEVAGILPHFDEIRKCPGRGVLITGPSPNGSGFDFFSRFFAPKLGVNEDAVCGSAHCALGPYWSEKLGKRDLIAYMASPRGGVLYLHVDEGSQRLRIRGEAVTVMEGSLLVAEDTVLGLIIKLDGC